MAPASETIGTAPAAIASSRDIGKPFEQGRDSDKIADAVQDRQLLTRPEKRDDGSGAQGPRIFDQGRGIPRPYGR